MNSYFFDQMDIDEAAQRRRRSTVLEALREAKLEGKGVTSSRLQRSGVRNGRRFIEGLRWEGFRIGERWIREGSARVQEFTLVSEPKRENPEDEEDEDGQVLD
jgi:hypothetical protein